MSGEPDYPTEEIRRAVNELLGRNRRTKGAEVGDLYLGEGILVARLKRTRIIDGKAVDIQDRTVDIFDLMDDYQREQR